MKTLIKLTTLLLLLVTTTSCFMDVLGGIKGNGEVVSEDRTISSNFSEIIVQQGIQVYLTQGNSTSLKVEADENILDILRTEVKNNQLKIYFDKNVYKASSKNVYVTANNITKIETSSGAAVKTENTIDTKSLNLDSSSGSYIKIYVNADNISSSSSSGAGIHIYGKSKQFSASASSGSSIDADKLETINTTAQAS
ncbi:head GIN domain-containing protein, partial [Lutibacter sp.]|uniref:head GIN domain-containing protein n=1 Tax=Lutibacter sp. TaxID=1925666 RepID=UPI003568CB57